MIVKIDRCKSNPKKIIKNKINVKKHRPPGLSISVKWAHDDSNYKTYFIVFFIAQGNLGCPKR